MTPVAALFLAISWRASVVKRARSKFQTLELEAELRAKLWDVQLKDIERGIAPHGHADVVAVASAASAQFKEFRDALDELTGKNAQNRKARKWRELFWGIKYVKDRKWRELFWGVKYVSRRDRLKEMLERVRTLMELTMNAIDQQEKQSISERLTEVCVQMRALQAQVAARG